MTQASGRPTELTSSGIADSAGPGSSGITGQSSLVGLDGRELFSHAELAIVLSHYELGIIRKIHPFNRGSRKAPKVVLDAEKGRFLLKRRAKGKDDPMRVALAHTLQLFLAERQFPMPHLIGTRPDNNSMLQLFGNIYEVFEYIAGQPYDGNLDATYDSGRVLGLYHKLLLNFHSRYSPPSGSYYNSEQVKQALAVLPGQFSKGERIAQTQDIAFGGPAESEEIVRTLRLLSQAYVQAGQTIRAGGMDDWPKQIVHSDWHPGNMLFLGNRVAGVIDYDSTRFQQRVTDLANGALQFSILGGADDPAAWPDYLDETRFKRFVRGYEAATPIAEGEIQVIPHLMIQALIAEAVLPVAATGSFGRIKGYPFLKMVARKVLWLQRHIADLTAAIVGD